MTTIKQIGCFVDEHLELLILGALAVLLVLAIIGSVEWEAFATEHHCVVIGHQESQSVTTWDGKVGWTNPQTTYRCDGGVVYVR